MSIINDPEIPPEIQQKFDELWEIVPNEFNVEKPELTVGAEGTMAYYDARQNKISIAQEILDLPQRQCLAVILHEVGHCVYDIPGKTKTMMDEVAFELLTEFSVEPIESKLASGEIQEKMADLFAAEMGYGPDLIQAMYNLGIPYSDKDAPLHGGLLSRAERVMQKDREVCADVPEPCGPVISDELIREFKSYEMENTQHVAPPTNISTKQQTKLNLLY